MKPTKMRNRLIYQATFHTKSKQLTSTLSKDLAKKYGKKSVRVIEGDSVKISRGEFKGVDGKISDVSIKRNGVAIEGIKKEKSKGDKFDVYIHTSNLVVTSLDTSDKWRIEKLQKGSPPIPSGDIADDGDKVQKSGTDNIDEQQEEVVVEKQDDTTNTQIKTKNGDDGDGDKDDEDSNDISRKEDLKDQTTTNDTKETKADISNAKEDVK